MSDRVNILHVSDLHYSKDHDYKHDIVISALLRDLKQRVPVAQKPNLVVFSGDLVWDGDDTDSYQGAFDNFLWPLLQTLELPCDNLFLAPGNHDARRSVITSQPLDAVHTGTDFDDRDSLNTFYKGHKSSSLLTEHFKNFNDLVALFGNKYRIDHTSFYSSHYIREYDLALVTLNTAWRTAAGIDEVSDRQRLLVPEAALIDAIKGLPEAKIKLLIGHHPSAWLAEYAEKDFIHKVGESFLCYLFGHMHDPQPGNYRTLSGDVFLSQSGALFTHRDRYNGYSIISVSPDTGHIEVNLRSYYEKRKEFDVATDIVARGRYYSSEHAAAFFRDMPRRIQPQVLDDWLRNCVLPQLESSLDEALADRKLSDVFVPPPLYRRIETQSAPDAEKVDLEEPIPLESVRKHQVALHSFRSMRRMEARCRKASAF